MAIAMRPDRVRSRRSSYRSVGSLAARDQRRLGQLAPSGCCDTERVTVDDTIALLRTLPRHAAPQELRQRLLAIPDDTWPDSG